MKEETAKTRYRQAIRTCALPVLPYGAVLGAVGKRKETLIRIIKLSHAITFYSQQSVNMCCLWIREKQRFLIQIFYEVYQRIKNNHFNSYFVFRIASCMAITHTIAKISKTATFTKVPSSEKWTATELITLENCARVWEDKCMLGR